MPACVLAGGLSTRMGGDKARLRLGSRTLLGWVRAAAREAGLPVRVIRRDQVPRCGPLGGVWTALLSCRAPAVLFLSCDMPFISKTWIRRVERQARQSGRAVFTVVDGLAGFPFALPADSLPMVQRQVEAGDYSLQSLARKLGATRVRPARRAHWRFLNVNTRQDLDSARDRLPGTPRRPAAYISKVRTLRKPMR